MLCYKDKTFCPFWKDCIDSPGCDRAFTPKVEVQAQIWWGLTNGPAPVSLYADTPDCYKTK